MPFTVRIDTGSNSLQAQVIPDASAFNDGVMSAAQAAKLDSLTPGGVGIGGYRQVANIAARDAIPSGQRLQGMWAITNDTGIIWQLEADLVTWFEVKFGGSSTGIDITATPFFAATTFATTGSIPAGSHLLTVAALGPIVAGCYVGVQGTESSGAAAMRGKVLTVSGLVLHLDTAATGTVVGAIVTTDAGPSIQAAVDAGVASGQAVFTPPGDFTVGVKLYAGNYPVVAKSTTRLLAAGKAVSSWTLSDEFLATPQGANAAFKSAAMIINEHNTWWDQSKHTSGPDTNIEIAGLTLNMNATGQTTLIAPINQSTIVAQRSDRGYLMQQDVTVGTLIANNWYGCVMVYTDGAGKECLPMYRIAATLQITGTSFNIKCPTAPAGAVNEVFYVRNLGVNDPLYPGVGHPTPWVQGSGDPLSTDLSDDAAYERVPSPGLHTVNQTMVISSHTTGTFVPTGWGLRGNAESTSSMGIFIDNADGVSVHDIEVKNSVLDGVNFASNQYLPSEYFTTKNVTCRNVYSHDNWRDGWGVTGALDGLLMDTCTAERCGDGADFETDEAGLPISNVDHVNCQFLSNAVPGGSGVSLAPTATGPFTNFRFTRCNWNWNLFHVLGQASFGATNVTFDDCFAINSLNHGIVLSPNAGTFVASINTFRDNGWPIGNTTDMNFYIPGSAVGIDIIIQDGSVDNASVLLSGNRHLGNAVDTGGNYAAVKLESRTLLARVVDNFCANQGSSVPDFEFFYPLATYNFDNNNGRYRVFTGAAFNVREWDTTAGQLLPGRIAATAVGVVVTTGLTTLTVTFSTAFAAGVNYLVDVTPHFPMGGWSLSAQDHTGFTIVWPTASVGTQALDWTARLV